MGSFILSPSLLSADFSKLDDELKFVEDNGGKWLHLDVMDGHFVPNLTFGAPVVKSLRKLTDMPFDVHLMVKNPEDYVDNFKAVGADWFTFHIEAAVHSDRLISKIKESGMKAGVSLVPSTPVQVISQILPLVDLVLVMSVNPGFSGQRFIPYCMDKISQLKELREKNGYNYLISVDGGINSDNISKAVEAGTDVVVSGSVFFSGELKV
ncbi:MAG: ribulose-phosphate 3-epimerase [Treponema sp.]|nr:MAG: ribulose-phosphate 3-epimerase [Treponema sp.]